MSSIKEFLIKSPDLFPTIRSDHLSKLTFHIQTPRFQASGHLIFFVFLQGQSRPICVIKIPRIKGENDRLNREANNLKLIHNYSGLIRNSIPRVIAYEEVLGNQLLVMSAMHGNPMKPAYVREKKQICFEMVLSWLIKLNKSTKIVTKNKNEKFDILVLKPILSFENRFDLSEDEKLLITKTKTIIEHFYIQNTHSVFEHGDFSSPNILIDEDKILSVVDWELAEPNGYPTIDLFFFLTYIAFAQEKVKNLDDYLTAFHNAFFGKNAWAKPYIRKYCTVLEIPNTVLKPLFIICWSRYLMNSLLRHLKPEKELTYETVKWVRSNRYYGLWKYAINHFDEINLY